MVRMSAKLFSVATRTRIFSGIQPTGTLHLGNYFGAVKRWVDSVESHRGRRKEALIPLIDLHAITVPQDSVKLRKNIHDMTASLLSCGLDPGKCILFQQSHVPQHAELSWILGCYVSLAMLQRLTQYKEKSATLKEVPLGLFTYPVLQSADILLYKATDVPVGEDNVQNVQMAQTLTRLFNNRHGKVFPRPNVQLLEASSASRLKSLRNPTKKMSKSDPDWRSCIYVTDPPETIVEKCKKALTDFTDQVTYDPQERPGVSNLITIHSSFTNQSEQEICDEVRDLNTARYKLYLADVINEHLRPIRTRFEQLSQEQDYLEKVLLDGARNAKQIAEDTMQEVKRAIGIFS